MLPADVSDRADEPVEYEFPVSPAQASLLVLEGLQAGSAQYHVPVAFAVHGPFDVNAFGRALDALVARHESLRTVFRTVDGEHRQVVAAEATADVRVDRDVSPAEVDAAMRAEAARPFDLAAGPLLRCRVYALTDGGHRILVTVHHLVCDGWSMEIMLRELAEHYRVERDGDGTPPQPPPIQFPDYAAWQRDRLAAGGYADSVAHWRQTLHGAPTVLALPGDRPRPAVQTPVGGVESFVLPVGLRERLARLARTRDTTPFVVLLAAYVALLNRLSGHDDLVVGIPVAGRDHPDVQGMVGLLTNTQVLRVDLAGEPSFTDLVDRVRDLLHAGRDHQDAPFSAVVDAVAPQRQPSHDPVVQVVFAYDDETVLDLDLPPARVERVPLVLDVAKFDLLLYVERWGSDLVGQFIYRAELFDRATVRHWVPGFQVLLDDLLDRPDRPTVAAEMLDAPQRRRMLHEWNSTTTDVPDRLVPDLVADRAAERPEATALVCGDIVLSYRELLTRADRLAAELVSAGVGPEVPVGLCLPRSAEMAVCALAVLRAGGAYLPLDPEQPSARLREMLTGAGARLVLLGTATARRAADLGLPALVVTPGAADVLTRPAPAPRSTSGTPGPDNAAYILYTSGSTGTPKGVSVPHRALTNLATAVRPQFPVTATDRVLQYVAFGFDVAVSDLFFTWVAGAELHIAEEHERLGEALYRRLRDSRITYVFLPPTAAMSLPCSPDALPDLRTIAVGGEPCPAELVDRWAVSGRRLLDAYGPSEATIYATTAQLRPGEPVVIGRPVANGRAYLLDRRLRPVPVGVVGEIYLAGTHLARGYANQPGLTAERFVANPFGRPGERMYRTGDLGRYDAEGTLSYLGRSDNQVKIRGFRVELGEIEAVLVRHPAVAAAVAAVLGDGSLRRLVAYVVGVDGAPPGTSELRGWLAERLPGYMVPESVVPLDELPTGRTGKVDRARLPAPPSTRPDLADRYVAPTTGTENRLATIWRQVLELDRVGVHDNFFELGGNSLRLLGVLSALRDQGVAGLSMVDLFRYPTVAALAAHLEGPGDPGPSAGVDAGRRRGQDRRARLMNRTTRARPSGDDTVEGGLT
ncbi:amino acid adenylation domain-containing protein [Micromonospora sp. NPDC005298]|uniref:non-ribosomal peptide synthetase n=1 Tax=Micromonospora sp. NPDC005298 TaxID=3156873 RepID=UPI0033A93F0C